MLTGDCRSRRSQFLPARPCSAVGSASSTGRRGSVLTFSAASRSSWRSACPAGSARSLDFLRRSRRKTRRELRLKCLVLRGQEARRVSLQTGNSDIYLVHRLLEAGLCLSQPIYGLRPGPIFNNGHRPARYRVWLQTPRWRLCLLARRRVQPVYETSALVDPPVARPASRTRCPLFVIIHLETHHAAQRFRRAAAHIVSYCDGVRRAHVLSTSMVVVDPSHPCERAHPEITQ